MAAGSKIGRQVLARLRASDLQTPMALLVLTAAVVFLAVKAVQGPEQFLSQLLIGITNGSIIALIALGYTLVYGIIELINFAHGDNFMLGSFIGVTVFGGLGLFSPVTASSTAWAKVLVIAFAMLVAMGISGIINVLIERIAYKPLRHAPRLAPLITAIGMSFVLQNVGLIWKGPSQINVPGLISHDNVFSGGISFRWTDLFVVSVTIPLLIALSWFVRSTKQGKAMRATAQDRDAAAMMGIDVNRTISITFLLGGMLAGASGVMFGLFNGTTVFDAGFKQGIFAFTAAVLGGIGNMTGAVVGGILIGIIGAMSDQYFSVRWTDPVIFAVLILVLVFRPTGILGERTPEG